jgi:tetratricopeptide (TPR) repeat protein
LKVASIQNELGQRTEAKDAVDAAKRLFEGLAIERPADQEIEQGLMEALYSAGDNRRAIDLGEGLLRKNPSNRDTRETLADAYNSRNVELSGVGDYVGAMAALGRSSVLMESF